jgi:hydroxyacylglutathione hydrolase
MSPAEGTTAMVIERFYTPGLAQVAYGVADPTTGDAAIIDPRRDIDDYLDWAAVHGYTIRAILETHVHADFVSGARELEAITGATVYAGRLGETEFPHQPLDDGDSVHVGKLKLRAYWTPGHTPEHMAYLLFDSDRGDDPVALFSGDILFAGEIGRPDLLGADRQKVLIQQLYKTVTERLAALPDAVAVYPGHGAGSPCGKMIGEGDQTTIGREKRFNYAFQAKSRDSFIKEVMGGMPKPPAYYPIMKRVNKAGPALVRDLPVGTPLSADDVAARQATGALVIDARSVDDFAVGHIPGAVAVGLGSNFAIWAGWLAPYDREVVLVLPDDDAYQSALTELRRIGVDNVAGYLHGGMSAWRASGRPIEDLPALSVNELASRIKGSANGLRIIDVRDETEWTARHIPGSWNLSTGALAQGVDANVDTSATMAVICETGFRSALAASLLQGRGYERVAMVPGGMAAWTAAGLPTTDR